MFGIYKIVLVQTNVKQIERKFWKVLDNWYSWIILDTSHKNWVFTEDNKGKEKLSQI